MTCPTCNSPDRSDRQWVEGDAHTGWICADKWHEGGDTMTLTELLDAKLALAEAASPAPWSGGSQTSRYAYGVWGAKENDEYPHLFDAYHNATNARFIADNDPEVVSALVEVANAAQVAVYTEPDWQGTHRNLHSALDNLHRVLKERAE